MFKLNGKICEGAKIMGYVVSNGTGIYAMDKDTALTYCKQYSIEGIKIVANKLSTGREVQKYTEEFVAGIQYCTVEELKAIETPNSHGLKYIDVKFFGGVCVKAKINVSGRLIYVVALPDNRSILVTKGTVGKLGMKGYADNCKIAVCEGHTDGFAVVTDAPYMDIKTIPIEQRVVYDVTGEIPNNDYKDGYVIKKLTFDMYNRLVNITVDKGPDGGEVTYGIIEYRKLCTEGATWSGHRLIRGENNKYPVHLDKSKNYPIIGEKFNIELATELLGGDKVVVDKNVRIELKGMELESLEDCISLAESVKPFISKLESEPMSLKIKDDADIECIGFCPVLNKGELRPKAQWNVVFKLDGEYILLPYNVVTRSFIQKKLDIDFDSLKVYDIGQLNTLKGYREYDIETKTTKIELEKIQ